MGGRRILRWVAIAATTAACGTAYATAPNDDVASSDAGAGPPASEDAGSSADVTNLVPDAAPRCGALGFTDDFERPADVIGPWSGLVQRGIGVVLTLARRSAEPSGRLAVVVGGDAGSAADAGSSAEAYLALNTPRDATCLELAFSLFVEGGAATLATLEPPGTAGTYASIALRLSEKRLELVEVPDGAPLTLLASTDVALDAWVRIVVRLEPGAERPVTWLVDGKELVTAPLAFKARMANVVGLGARNLRGAGRYWFDDVVVQ